MGTAVPPKSVCLVAALCFNDHNLKESIVAKMEKEYGAVQFELAPVLFSHTNYYGKEMGAVLEKMYVAFADYIDPACLPRIKHFTNALEQKSAANGNRSINIDPGYIEVPKLVLATTKNFSHRIYIGEHIYGDVQLYWRNGGFQPNPWTYPDYRDSRTIRFFEKVRNTYFDSIKGNSSGN